jgi:hypothetical protein
LLLTELMTGTGGVVMAVVAAVVVMVLVTAACAMAAAAVFVGVPGNSRALMLTVSRLLQWPHRTVTVLNRLLVGTLTCNPTRAIYLRHAIFEKSKNTNKDCGGFDHGRQARCRRSGSARSRAARRRAPPPGIAGSAAEGSPPAAAAAAAPAAEGSAGTQRRRRTRMTCRPTTTDRSPVSPGASNSRAAREAIS